jgi:hypothetical protein
MSRSTDSALDPRVRRSIIAVALTGGGLSLVALLFFGMGTALSVAVGAGIAAANLWALARIIGALLPGDTEGARAQSKAGWGLVGVLKMLGLVAGVLLLMRHGVVSTLPMLIGFFGSLPIGIAIGSLVSDRSAPPVDEDGDRH